MFSSGGIMKMMKERVNAKQHSDGSLEISGHGTLEDKLWQTVVEEGQIIRNRCQLRTFVIEHGTR